MRFLVLLALAVGPFALASAESRSKAYGTRVSFQKARPLRFPDFVLEYVGDRRVTSKQYPRGFRYRDFAVSAGSERNVVTWSAGTGDIGPARFTIAGRNFDLELVSSDSLGSLKPNELVVTVRSE